jgi:hypothetical protein
LTHHNFVVRLVDAGNRLAEARQAIELAGLLSRSNPLLGKLVPGQRLGSAAFWGLWVVHNQVGGIACNAWHFTRLGQFLCGRNRSAGRGG